MWANFGMAIQIKHLSLTEYLAENIVSSVSSDRIVIVCKDTEQKIIVSLLNQIGWKSKIQSIVTETDLIEWYEKSLRGKFSNIIGDNRSRRLRRIDTKARAGIRRPKFSPLHRNAVRRVTN